MTEIKGIGDARNKSLIAGGVTTFAQLAKMTADELRTALGTSSGFGVSEKDLESIIAQARELAGDSLAVDGSSGLPLDPDKSLAQFPRQTELPSIENIDEVKISDLVISNQSLLQTELLSPEWISRGRVSFELERDPDDNQRWIVAVKKSANQKPVAVASFRKTADAYLFQWLTEAARNRNAILLRNCSCD